MRCCEGRETRKQKEHRPARQCPPPGETREDPCERTDCDRCSEKNRRHHGFAPRGTGAVGIAASPRPREKMPIPTIPSVAHRTLERFCLERITEMRTPHERVSA